MDDYVILEGIISVCAAIKCGNRTVDRVWINKKKKHDKRTHSKLLKLAQRHNVLVEYMPYEEIEKHLHGKTSGGIIAFASERHFMTVDEMYSITQPSKWVALEGFEDPYSYGNAVRTLYAAGFNGLLTVRQSWNKADTLLLKASAGAAEILPTALIDDYDKIVAYVKHKGFKVICAEQSQMSVSLYDLQITPPYLIVIGGEKRGIAKPFVNAADFHITIPYGRDVSYALSGASAAAVIAFEVFRQELSNTK